MAETRGPNEAAPAPTAAPEAPRATLVGAIVVPFRALAGAPLLLTAVLASCVIEGFCYRGWLALLAPIFYPEIVGLSDPQTTVSTGVLTWGITLSMALLGGLSDRLGVRRALLLGLLLFAVGRGLWAGAAAVLETGGGAGSALHLVSLLGSLGVVLGYGLYGPATYAGVRATCDERTAALGYALIYALGNAGATAAGFASPLVREAAGPRGVLGVLAVATLLGLGLVALLTAGRRGQTPRAAAATTTPGPLPPPPALPLLRRAVAALRAHPLADPRFAFLLLALMPAQTLFAHQSVTMPTYVYRALGEVGRDWFEVFANAVNPPLLFVLVPLFAVLTRRTSVYRLVLVGTALVSVPALLLAIAPSPWLVLAYLVALSAGEALWVPRMFRLAAELAPEGRTGAYVGVVQLPWLATKIVTSIYAGHLVERFCPAEGPKDTTTMWLLNAGIGMVTPLLLLVASRWAGAVSQRSVATT